MSKAISFFYIVLVNNKRSKHLTKQLGVLLTTVINSAVSLITVSTDEVRKHKDPVD